jgi:uncharacterized protein YqgC (DUF456 family)
VKTLLLLTLAAALPCLVIFQTSTRLLIRSAGLFLILTCALIWQFQVNSQPNDWQLLWLVILLVVGMASDVYSPSLRTWGVRVSDSAFWGLLWGSFIGGFMLWSYLGSIGGILLGALLGALLGEIKERGFQPWRQLCKASLGACVSVFGMSLKLLVGLEMILSILHGFRTPV